MTSVSQSSIAITLADIEPDILNLMMDGRSRTRDDIALRLRLPADTTTAALRRMKRDNLLGSSIVDNVTIWKVSARYRPLAVRHDH